MKMFTTPILEEKLRVQAELSARCRSMADYFAHNEATARKLESDGRARLRYRLPEGFQPPAAAIRPAGAAARRRTGKQQRKIAVRASTPAHISAT